MNAPEKVYLKIDHPISDDYTEMIAFKDGDGVEYTRTVAFIEKACEWLADNARAFDEGDIYNAEDLVEHFRNYMKGE